MRKANSLLPLPGFFVAMKLTENEKVDSIEILSWGTYILSNEMEYWQNLVLSGKNIPQEAIGILIGRAKPLFKKNESK